MVFVGVDSIFPFCEFSYDGIGLDAEVEAASADGVMSCIMS